MQKVLGLYVGSEEMLHRVQEALKKVRNVGEEQIFWERFHWIVLAGQAIELV